MTKKTTSIKKPTRKPARKPAAKAATVDFPREDEVVLSSDYTFRIDAPGAWSVELSVDGGDWVPCREAVGYWWFDWRTAAGSHELVARVRKASGKPSKSEPRKFRVDLG